MPPRIKQKVADMKIRYKHEMVTHNGLVIHTVYLRSNGRNLAHATGLSHRDAIKKLAVYEAKLREMNA